MGAQVCNPNNWEHRQKDQEFKAKPAYYSKVEARLGNINGLSETMMTIKSGAREMAPFV